MKTLLLLAAFMAAPFAHSATLWRIACGSATGGTDAAGRAWQADAFVTGGTAYATPSLAALDLPYRALRYGAAPFSYALPLPAGQYTVTLHFLENRTAASVPPVAAGQRQFSVNVNGAAAVTNLDLFAAAGSMHPYTVTASVTLAAGPLAIVVTPTRGNALLSGIQVDSVEAPPVSRQYVCEDVIDSGIGFGTLFPGVYHLRSCVNTTELPRRVLRVICEADGMGAVLDLMAPGPTGELQSLLTAPLPCLPEGNAADALPSATYPPRRPLHWMIRVNDTYTPDAQTAQYVLATVIMEP